MPGKPDDLRDQGPSLERKGRPRERCQHPHLPPLRGGRKPAVVDSCEEMIHISDAIINHITFDTDDASLAALRSMLQEVQRTAHPLGSIDFNKLIPTPKELSIEHSDRTVAGLKLYRTFMKESADLMKAALFTDKDERSAMETGFRTKWEAAKQQDPGIWALGEQAHENIMKYDCPTWYEWRKLHWGTVSNAAEFANLSNDGDVMTFTTDGAAVPKLVQAMSVQFPEQKITYSWADGDTRQHLGRMVFQGGRAIEVDIPQEPGALAHAMSAGVWRFQSAMEQGSRNARTPQKKNHHRGQGR